MYDCDLYNKFKEDVDKYGKYTQRNIERTDIFGLPEKMKNSNLSKAYQPNSGAYG